MNSHHAQRRMIGGEMRIQPPREPDEVDSRTQSRFFTLETDGGHSQITHTLHVADATALGMAASATASGGGPESVHSPRPMAGAPFF